MGYTGQGVVVAGQDTGYQWDHLALKELYRGWDGAVADHNYNWHAGSPASCEGYPTVPSYYSQNLTLLNIEA